MSLYRRHKEAPGCVWVEGMVGPSCRPPSALKKAAMAGKDSYYDMIKYANITTWIFAALIALAILPNLLHRLRVARPAWGRRIARVRGYKTTAALLRRVGYWVPRAPQQPSLLHKTLQIDRMPPLGATLLISVVSIGLFVWCLAVKPWYRPSAVWGSTPLGVRTGMVANGMVPFMFAFAMKFNPITWVTGISHERLQLYHQWTARLILLFSIIHTAAFIWQPIHDGGFSNFQAWFHYDKVWWTGSVCIVLFAWIVASSTSVFRNMSYEFFVVQHVVTVVLFLAFYFLHTRDLIASWSWLWPSVALWAFATFYRWASGLRASSFGRSKALVQVEADSNVIRIALNAPVTWSAAQHFLIRFPTMAVVQAHPFTVLTMPSRDPHKESQLVFLARVRGGITRQLADHVAKGEAMVPAIIDGPYGAESSMASYDAVLLVSGGVGITFCLAVLMDLATHPRSVTTRVTLLWSMRSVDILPWFEPYLDAAVDTLRDRGVDITLHLHVTGPVHADDKKEIVYSRPELPTFITAYAKDCEGSAIETLSVVVCGPESMANDTANTVSSLQKRLLKPTSLREVYLHKESFSW